MATNDLDYIIPDLRQFAVPIDSISPDPANAMEHTDYDIGHIAASIRKYGQRVPIFVNRRNNVIEAGEGRWRAMKSLGYTHIAAVGVEDDEITAIGFGIADNTTGRIAQFDPEKLKKLLEGLGDDNIPGVTYELLAGFNELDDNDFIESDFSENDFIGATSNEYEYFVAIAGEGTMAWAEQIKMQLLQYEEFQTLDIEIKRVIKNA